MEHQFLNVFFFKSGSLLNMWQSLVEFHLVTSEDGVRKKRRKNLEQNIMSCREYA